MRRWKWALAALLALPLSAAAGTTGSATTQTSSTTPATAAPTKKSTAPATQAAKQPTATQPPATQPPATTATTSPSALLRPTTRRTTTTTVAPASAGPASTAAAASSTPVDTSLLTRDAPSGDAATRKDWKTWDDGAAERAKSTRFRLAAGVRSGSLSLADTRTLMTQERAITQLSEGLKGDDKVDDAERGQIRELLTKVNGLVFSNRNDTAPLNSALLKRIDGGDLTVADAKDLCAEIKRLFELYRVLSANQTLPSDQRAELGREYDQLVAILHE